MKQQDVVIIGVGDVGQSAISSLYQTPIETIIGVITTERARPAEIRDLSNMIQINIINNEVHLDLPVIEEPEIKRWPNDKLLVKRGKLNTKGFKRKGINPGRR